MDAWWLRNLSERLRAEAGRQTPDPVALARAAGLSPDPWQADVLRSAADRILLNCSRQVGKSTVTSVMAVHLATTEPNSLTLLLSPAERQSKELLLKCKDVYRGGEPPVLLENDNVLFMSFENRSRIIALPGKDGTIRGFSGVDLLAIDEASRVPDELYYAVRPMLAVSGGRLLALSSPFGKRGWWYEAWENGGATWERYRVTAEQCPRIPRDFLEEERRTLPDAWFRQEYFGEFMDVFGGLFTHDQIVAAMSDGVLPMFDLSAPSTDGGVFDAQLFARP